MTPDSKNRITELVWLTVKAAVITLVVLFLLRVFPITVGVRQVSSSYW